MIEKFLLREVVDWVTRNGALGRRPGIIMDASRERELLKHQGPPQEKHIMDEDTVAEQALLGMFHLEVVSITARDGELISLPQTPGVSWPNLFSRKLKWPLYLCPYTCRVDLSSARSLVRFFEAANELLNDGVAKGMSGLGNHLLGSAPRKAKILRQEMRLIEHCEGMDAAIYVAGGLSDATLRRWLWLPSAAHSNNICSATGGRPRMVECVAEAYQRQFPNGHTGYTMKEVLRRLEIEEEIPKVSEQTLRRAIKSCRPKSETTPIQND